MAGRRMTPALALADIRRHDAPRAGQKAAHLGDLLSAGLPVPDGFVIAAGAATDDGALAAAVAQGLALLGGAGVTVAVRSSSVAEDRCDASFAGIYETVLDVSGAEAIAEAVRRCRTSASDARAAGYRPGDGGDQVMAVLVQRMVRAECAGVAFTADPVTGDRAQVLVIAAAGLGDRLVAGGERGERWVVAGGEAHPAEAPGDRLLDRRRAQEIAALARRVEAHFGGPQDIEWAIAEGRVFLLQARPMTALPAEVRWDPPRPGGWLRNFRLGEWLPEPVTPLFESWFLERCEATFAEAHGPPAGFVPPPPRHVVVNGWYFHSPLGSGTAALFLRGLLVRPRASLALMRVDARPETADRLIAAPHTRAWREEILPAYRALVARAEHLLDGAAGPPSAAAMVRMIDEVADLLGGYLWSMAMVGGFAWKLEAALARFCKRHLARALPDGHQGLVVGLTPPAPTPPHAVHNLDWYRPTAGELGLPPAHTLGAPPDRHAPLAAGRAAVEARCREALARSPRLRKRFDLLLALAQRYAVLREEQAACLTLGWPVMRRALAWLGRHLAGIAGGDVATSDDVFFLTRPELDACLAGAGPAPIATVASRRRAWEAARRLSPPLVIGRLSPVLKKLFGEAVEAMRAPVAELRPGALRGMPAGPGRATGKVRVLRTPAEAGRLQPGDVLVTATATPAWTPLFDRAAALVTDGGSIVAHSSLVAREYGLPVVVATGDATARLSDGQLVVVDGSRGTVEPM